MPSFRLAINKIPHDKLWIKYTGYNLDPYGQWLQYLKEHPEYTHIAICPDDLIPHPKGVEKLWKEAQKGTIVSACANVDKNTFDCPYRTSWPITATKNLPSLKFPRNYDWYTWHELKEQRNGKGSLVQVKHSGVAFMILSRAIIPKIGFCGDMGSLSEQKPSAYDVGISHDLINQNIPQYIDTDVFFAHFRYGSKILNREKEPHLIVDNYNKEDEVRDLYKLEPFVR